MPNGNTVAAMVKIKRVYDPESPSDGKRILIDRLWPRGTRKGSGVDSDRGHRI